MDRETNMISLRSEAQHRMGRVDRNWPKSGESLISHGREGLLGDELAQVSHYPE